MRCFYCAEDIRDEAVVCRHCGRDLNFARPFAERIASLEKRYEELAALVTLDRSAQPTAVVERDVPLRRIVIPASIAVLLSALAYFAFRRMHMTPMLLVSLGMPLPFGLWAGLWTPGKQTRTYFLTGAIAGLLTFGVVSIIAFAEDWTAFSLGITFWDFFTRYVVGTSLFFATGGLLGDQIERHFAPVRPSAGGAAVAIAHHLIVKTGTAAGDESRTRTVADFITAMAPLFTFIGSLVTAYLTYQAALHKK